VFVFVLTAVNKRLFVFTSFSMGLPLVGGGQENIVKTHKNGLVNFHLKGGSRQGPTKVSQALPAEGCHREGRLAQASAPMSLHSYFPVAVLTGNYIMV